MTRDAARSAADRLRTLGRWTGWTDRRTWTRVVFLLSSFPVGQIWALSMLTLVVVGVACLVVWIGLIPLAAAFHLTRTAARIERRRVRWGLGLDIAAPYRPDPAHHVWHARLADPATRRDVAYALLLWPLGVLWLVVTFSISAWPVMFVALPHWFADPWWGRVLVGAAGLGLLLIVPRAFEVCAAMHAVIARRLLSPSRGTVLHQTVADLRRRRDQSVHAAVDERRRIERGLHDGAQQRLVAVAMELGRASTKFDDDLEAARELVEHARDNAVHALAELRDLARGIMPAVLTDRGLGPAVSSLAAASGVDVDVEGQISRRLSAPIEATAYFVISEALTNVAKHADATRARILMADAGAVIRITVIDDGRGGADPTGPGLSNLADRVAAIEGTLTVDSPPGGPTRVHAELPCA